MRRTTNSGEDTALSISKQDRQDIEGLYEALRRGKAQLVSPEGGAQHLPDSVYQFLTELLAQLGEGKCIQIVQHQAKLTTVEAAALLGMSRQFLVNLLERNEIPHHMVGTHRRMYAIDVLRYKAKRDSARRQALRDLVQAELEEGLYTLPPDGV